MDAHSTAGASVTEWIAALKGGDPAAAAPLWERYFDRLHRLAERRGARGPMGDGEDAALSALDTFIRHAAEGKFPGINDRDGLWRLLVTITYRKVADLHARRREVPVADLDGGPAASGAGLLERLPDGSFSPEVAAQAREEFRRILGRLGDDDLRAIAVLKLEGYSKNEIAARMGCSLKTVFNKVELIQRILESELRRVLDRDELVRILVESGLP